MTRKLLTIGLLAICTLSVFGSVANARFGGRIGNPVESVRRVVERTYDEVAEEVEVQSRRTQNPLSDPNSLFDPRRTAPAYRLYLQNNTGARLGIWVEFQTQNNAWTKRHWVIDPGQKLYLLPSYNRYIYVSGGSLDTSFAHGYPRTQIDMGAVFNEYTLNLR